MRKIKIINASVRFVDSENPILCPMCFNQTFDKADINCTTYCAWFNIEEYNLQDIIIKKAFCKDHCIGEVVE